MTDTNRARAYAEALLRIVTESLVAQLGSVQRGVAANPAVSQYLSDPTVEFRDKMTRVAEFLPPGAAPELRKFLGLMLSEGGVGDLDQVIAELTQLAQGGDRATEAMVRSAVPLTAQEQDALRQKLMREAGSNLDLAFEVDPDLIGGLVVRVGDRVVDASVASRLRQLRESILKAL